MGFRPGSFATIWSVEPGTGNFSKVRMSISRKNKDTGVYEDEFSGFVMFIGEAHAKAGRLKERDRIKLGDVDVTRRYDKEKNREYYNFKVFSFDMADAPAQSGNAVSNPVTSNPIDSNPVDGDALPF